MLPLSRIAGLVKRRVARPVNRRHSKSVLLDLEQPVIAIERLAAALDDLERRLSGPKHRSYFPEKRCSLKAGAPPINAFMDTGL